MMHGKATGAPITISMGEMRYRYRERLSSPGEPMASGPANLHASLVGH